MCSLQKCNNKETVSLYSNAITARTETNPHLMMFSMQALWRKKALTTGVPDATRGALQRKDKSDRILWKDWNSSSP